MSRNETLDHLRAAGLVPILRTASADEALWAADAIQKGGVSILEITMTVPGALRVIEEVAARSGALVGAGTVLDAEQALAAIHAGARFIVSPALSLPTIELCRRHGVVVMPGALTPTEVVTAWQAGADFVKIFPCSALGGASYLKALKGPLPQIEMVPTGGVSLATAAAFLEAGAAALGVGADLVDPKALAARDAAAIAERAARFAEIVRATRARLAGS